MTSVKTQPRGVVKHSDSESRSGPEGTGHLEARWEKRRMTQLASCRAVKGEQADSIDLVQGYHLSEDVKESLLCY